ncbi:MAG TPA: hypothetical protein VNN21_08020 [Dehalococcoidia bacterium]|nr:hypothetical protein [Dehalococcoidia bacterium]
MSGDLTFSSDFGSDWNALVRDLEQRVESAQATLAELRTALARLAAFEPRPALAEPPSEAAPDWKFDGYEAAEDKTAAGGPAFVLAEDEPDRVREEVSRTVAEIRAELENGSMDVDATSEGSWPVLRPLQLVDVTLQTEGVEDGGLETAISESERREADAAQGWPASDEDAARRNEVAKIVAQMRGELASGFGSLGFEGEYEAEGREPMPGLDPDEDARREEVRRAVEAARAELAGTTLHREPEPRFERAGETEKASDLSRFAFSDWPSAQVETSGPPVIVIKDQDGRVELARVYETLKRIDCGENAALLNYTPHSVTIGLSARANVPSREEMSKAVEQVFGRSCRVQSDGVRLSVDLGRE